MIQQSFDSRRRWVGVYRQREAVVGRMRGRRSVLFWVFIVVVVILLLGLVFGGYRKGTKVGMEPVHPYHAYSLTLD